MNPIICALDTKDTQHATRLAASLKPYIGMVKLGLEFFTKNGPEGIRQVASAGLPIFLDLKFHDIPNTVAQAVRSAISLDVRILTIHGLGGLSMMKAAAEAAAEEADKQNKTCPLVVAITVLTSMDGSDLQGIGISRSPAQQVEILAPLAKEAGLGGVVCSPHEIAQVKALCGTGFKTVVPGIRPASADKGDQKRTLSPAEAIAQGADYLVIGRPITQSPDPAEAAKEIAASL